MQDKPIARKPGHYSIVQRFSYTPFDQENTEQPIWRLAFPNEWSRKLSGIQFKYDLNKSNNGQLNDLPFRSLNSTLLLASPQVITPGFQKDGFGYQSSRRLFMSSDPDYLCEPITDIVKIWARHHFNLYIAAKDNSSSESARGELDDILASLQPTDLHPEKYLINLARPELNSKINLDRFVVDRLFYKALPGWLVNCFRKKIFKLGDYEFTMRRTQKPPQRGYIGVELMSWPPIQLVKGFMSLVLEFDVQTLPGQSNRPLVYPRWHVRRWIHKSLVSISGNSSYINMPYEKGVTVYVQNQIPWLEELAGSQDSLATTSIKLKRGEEGMAPIWEDHLNDLLTKVGGSPFVDAESFIRQPLRFQDKPAMGGVFSGSLQYSMKTTYPIGDGLFLRDLQELMEQLDPELRSIGFSCGSQNMIEPLSLAKVRKPKTTKINSDLMLLDPMDQAEIRQALEDTIPNSNNLVIEIRYLQPETASAIWEELFKHFGLSTSFISPSSNIFTSNGVECETPEGRKIKVLAIPNPFQKLEIQSASTAGYQSAVIDFIGQIEKAISKPQPGSLTVTFIELKNYTSGRKRIEQMQDAKDASRFGYSLINRPSQFIEPIPTGGNQDEKEAAEKLRKNKARAAVLDMRRQLGFMETNLVEALECTGFKTGTQLIGLHLEQRNSTRKNKRQGYSKVTFPAAVRLTIGKRQVEALVPDREGKAISINWIPYMQAALQIGSLSGKQLMTGEEPQEQSMIFLTNLLNLLGDAPAILFVSSNIWRSTWPWLQDQHIKCDEMKVGDAIIQPAGAQMIGGSTRVMAGLRVIRYRTDEVPEYLAIDPTKPKEDQAGHGHGIIKISDRIYYSIAPKPDSYQKPYRFSRVGDGRSKDARISSPVEVVPAFIQKGDTTDELVKVFHILRAATSHWKEGLITSPLPNHLAERMVRNYLVMRTYLDLNQPAAEDEES